jgi:hypothetical protein
MPVVRGTPIPIWERLVERIVVPVPTVPIVALVTIAGVIVGHIVAAAEKEAARSCGSTRSYLCPDRAQMCLVESSKPQER